jgi:hypothetical protein
MNLKGIKKISKIFLPDGKDLTLLVKGFFALLVALTFINLIQYTASQTNAQSTTDTSVGRRRANNSLDSIADKANVTLIGYGLLSQSCPIGSNLAESTAGPNYDANPCNLFIESGGTPKSGFIEMDMGAVGRLINSSSAMYDTKIASPSTAVQYYASRLKGTAYAAESRAAGREVLAPVFFMSQAMRNIAYGVVVIILVISALSTLISYIGNSEQKITLIQLMINTALTLVFITFFYEIAAIIYDLTVNYGNTLVASAMEPFINAQIILERLQAGGDLNVTALVNTFQFSGVSQGIVTVANNVLLGLKPAISQSIDALGSNLLNEFGSVGKLIGGLNSYAASGVSFGASGIISSLLGSQAIFDALIAWTFFFINVRIWANLFVAFVSYNLYVGFGPLMMLSGIGGGYDKIKNTFKTLFAYGLVFPVTFLFILLGATMMNFFIRNNLQNYSNEDGTVKTPLCVYRPGDPADAEASLANRDASNGFGDDPTAFRKENTDFQDVFDTKPAYYVDGQRACRSSLFPVPWTFLPAPLGNYGNRLLQIQTTDTLMRTVMSLVFMIMATRAPALIKELLQVQELKSLQGMGKALKSGVSPLLGVGAAGAGIALGLSGKVLGAPFKIPLGEKRKKAIQGTALYGQLANWTSSKSSIYDIATGMKSNPDYTKGLKGFNSQTESDIESTLNNNGIRGGGAGAVAGGLRPNQNIAQQIMIQGFAQNLVQGAQDLSQFSNFVKASSEALEGFQKRLTSSIGELSKIAGLATANDFD